MMLLTQPTYKNLSEEQIITCKTVFPLLYHNTSWDLNLIQMEGKSYWLKQPKHHSDQRESLFKLINYRYFAIFSIIGLYLTN